MVTSLPLKGYRVFLTKQNRGHYATEQTALRFVAHSRGKVAIGRRFCKVQENLKDTMGYSLSSNGKCEFPMSHLSTQRDINIPNPSNS